MTRLIYEKKAGELSEAETFKQLIEYLHLIQEDAERLAGMRITTRPGWKAIANCFRIFRQQASHLSNIATKTSTGYESH